MCCPHSALVRIQPRTVRGRADDVGLHSGLTLSAQIRDFEGHLATHRLNWRQTWDMV
eukprot:NODE_2317_length_1150_cov_13.216167_g1924_i0.p4 GENE.NODE_2317_length_1150_cov_13.216167_g1924_i0~~NODE_2317_length_1150_cov_13.216167_g1924_i0.p4  ORF type:complete len:57 (-),score=0.99 NODE_2317_length_1150_cov_13.216167_g1924_i0:18-188(-)